MDSTAEQQEQGNSGSSDMRLAPGEEPVVAPVVTESAGRAAVDEAAQSPQAVKAMSEEKKQDAMAWLLQDAPEDPSSFVQRWEINVGTDDAPNYVEWAIKPIDADTMNQLRRRGRAEAGQNRDARRAGTEPEIDVTVLNLRMVAVATVEPDLQEASRLKGTASADPLMGPVLMLAARFRHKPGIVDQIAQRVMLFSGYDEQDIVRSAPEIKMIHAAGNS